MDDKINFYKHCDEENCYLGHAEYRCPKCGCLNEDFSDLWFQYESRDANRVLLDSCHGCSSGMVAKYKDNEGWVIRGTR